MLTVGAMLLLTLPVVLALKPAP
eukprot:COSAG05_NODE_19871_length_286_cov_1.385027_2_plen_22_part_01